ncbi:zinc finger protein 622 [Schistocerca cancellata]|uniref:zinc finger protein 622 n=1 Tax=Schistocerca cancellata TaxID=274614 RepID=UPI002118C348|nr:zinc finger protein 622 [Schistocerca cancellata]
MSGKYTCITCRVAFSSAEIQRMHYKTDWHRYNLKRKVAELSPVTAEEFQRRVLQQREEDNDLNKNCSFHCDSCRKLFNTKNAYENHLNSKKHQESVLTNSFSSPGTPEKKKPENDTDSEDSEIEEVDSDEWDEDSEDNPILNNNCLFCSHHSRNLMKNLKHMSVAHSFFIPDAEYVVDLKGLLMYLGEKVSQDFMCLWCNDRGRTFYSAEAAKQHMQDKGHCKMLHEGEALTEYADFYDYSSSYPDQDKDPDEEVDITALDDSDYQLVLPSGTVIGHRSLLRYYKQNLKPESAVVTPHQKKLHRVLAQYRALGWTETQQELTARKARDIHYMKRLQAKYSTKLGMQNNKLQKHFRPQVNF